LTHNIDPIGQLGDLVKKSGLPQKDVAAQAEISDSYLSEILSRKANPTVRMINRIADAVTFLKGDA